MVGAKRKRHTEEFNGGGVKGRGQVLFLAGVSRDGQYFSRRADAFLRNFTRRSNPA